MNAKEALKRSKSRDWSDYLYDVVMRQIRRACDTGDRYAHVWLGGELYLSPAVLVKLIVKLEKQKYKVENLHTSIVVHWS